MLNKEIVYVALGANLGQTQSTIELALKKIEALKGISDLDTSNFYLTSPVSSIPQQNYLNCVCRFSCKLTPKDLFFSLQNIEMSLGKTVKPPDAPRMIDLDILFFGHRHYRDRQLEIPHPRWQERLFVLIPLLDLTNEVIDFDSNKNLIRCSVGEIVKTFSNIHREQVSLVNRNSRV